MLWKTYTDSQYFLEAEEARRLRPEMEVLQDQLRRQVQSDFQRPNWWEAHGRFNAVAMPEIFSKTGWTSEIRPFQAPRRLVASAGAEKGLLSLPTEILMEILRWVQTESGQVTAAVLACRTLALTAQGLNVDIGHLTDLVYGPRSLRYCGGCHHLRWTRWKDWMNRTAMDDADDYRCAASSWLLCALRGGNSYVDLRCDAADEVRVTDKRAVMHMFIEDWVDEIAWEKDAHCLRSFQNPGEPETVPWCPLCRAQKVCEDKHLCQLIADTGAAAHMDIILKYAYAAQETGSDNVYALPLPLPDSLRTNYLLGKSVRTCLEVHRSARRAINQRWRALLEQA